MGNCIRVAHVVDMCKPGAEDDSYCQKVDYDESKSTASGYVDDMNWCNDGYYYSIDMTNKRYSGGFIGNQKIATWNLYEGFDILPDRSAGWPIEAGITTIDGVEYYSEGLSTVSLIDGKSWGTIYRYCFDKNTGTLKYIVYENIEGTVTTYYIHKIIKLQPSCNVDFNAMLPEDFPESYTKM